MHSSTQQSRQEKAKRGYGPQSPRLLQLTREGLRGDSPFGHLASGSAPPATYRESHRTAVRPFSCCSKAISAGNTNNKSRFDLNIGILGLRVYWGIKLFKRRKSLVGRDWVERQLLPLLNLTFVVVFNWSYQGLNENMSLEKDITKQQGMWNKTLDWEPGVLGSSSSSICNQPWPLQLLDPL